MSFISEIIRDCGVKKPTITSTLIALVFGLIFGAGGLLIFASEFLTPLSESREAKKWVAIEAIVIKSELEHHDESININLIYSYLFNGNEYRGDRFELSGAGRNFDTNTYKDTVKNYPIGSKINIWVNPSNPEQSVYKREMVTTNWIALPFSIPFLTVGLCGLLFVIFNGTLFRIQRQAWKEAAKIASRHSAIEINKALLDEDFHNRERAEINFLKREKFLASIGYLLVSLFVNGIVSVFVILAISMHINDHPFAYPLSIFLIPFVTISLAMIRKFFTSLFSGKGADYVIISEWDYEHTQVTHNWLLLSDTRDADEIGIFTCATQKSKELKAILRKNPFKDVFKSPNKSVIVGSIVHPISGSSKKEINLLIYTKNKSQKKHNKHQLTLYTPDHS